MARQLELWHFTKKGAFIEQNYSFRSSKKNYLAASSKKSILRSLKLLKLR